MQGEFLRVFAATEADCLEWAFREWRQGSSYLPTIADIGKLIERYRQAQREEAEQFHQLGRRFWTQLLDRARNEGKLIRFGDVLRQFQENIARLPEPEAVRKRREYERRQPQSHYATPAVVMTPEQILQRVEQERADPKHRAELERYEAASSF